MKSNVKLISDEITKAGSGKYRVAVNTETFADIWLALDQGRSGPFPRRLFRDNPALFSVYIRSAEVVRDESIPDGVAILRDINDSAVKTITFPKGE